MMNKKLVNKEVEEEFYKVVKEIKKYSKYTEERIMEALVLLYDEVGGIDPMNDWNNDYLTLNKGRKIKEILNYYDSNSDTFRGVSLKSLRLMESNELEKEIC